MLRITELRLPLNHADDALRAAVVTRLGAADADLLAFSVFRRSYDARKKSAIVLTYTVDCDLVDEAGVLTRLAGQPRASPPPTPTSAWRPTPPTTSSAMRRRASTPVVGRGRW